MHAVIGAEVERGQPLFTLHSQAAGQLEYAASYVQGTEPIVLVQPS